VNPGFILGPVLVASNGSSEQLLKEFLSGKAPGVPKINLCVVDVRDVAECHLKVLASSNSNGKRYICSAESLWMSDMTGILRKDKRVRDLLDEVNHERKADNRKSIEELGLQYRSPKESIIDMGYSSIKFGAVPDKINQK